ncbi:MAG: FliA/WhiG family RNA polymerase sigma factor [Nitrospirae bacterium]|nr:FliA/WhiG family RNA polymerase sigma factor [Nitrospirota bacterium]
MAGYEPAFTEEDKEKIIRDFLPFVKYTASRLSWRLPPQLTIDDLISTGLMGLLDALERFEPGRVKLKTYAEFRIKGAMLDELRAMDWVPRSTKKKISDIRNANSRLERELGREPEDEEVAAILELELDEYYGTLQEASGSISLRFEDFEENAGEGLNIMECIADEREKSPLALLEESDQKKVLARFITQLPEKEKLLLSLYYWDELTMKEIGKVMNLTEGRVCQLHTQALIRLKAKVSIEFSSKEK